MKNQTSKLLKQAVNSTNRFQFDFYNQFSEQENLMISPLGLYFVLAMLHEGSRGETRTVLSNLLHHDYPEISIMSGMKMLLKELCSRTQLTAIEKKMFEEMEADKKELISRGEWNEGYAEFYGTATAEDIRIDLSIANGMWLQDSYEYKSEFLNTVKTEMAAEIGYLDFDNDPVLSCQTINNWIHEKTRGLIKDMISPHNLPKPCLLLLGNALYFKARWEIEFGDPIAGPFHLLDGKRVEAQMMTHKFWGLNYMLADNFLAVELPYYRRPISMIIFTPIQYGLEAFVEMEREFYHHWNSFQLHRRTKYQGVTLTMPEFKIEAGHSFKHQLTALGVGDIFSQKADFLGVSDEEGIYVSDIIQNTSLAVDQYGTEAAAATMGGMFAGHPPEEEVTLTIDHPFLFAIVDKPSEVILFVGKVTNPI